MIPFWKKTGKHSKPQSAQKRRQNAKPAVPRTAQQSIPMQRMFEDGTCRVKPNYYTRTIQYQDINYQLAQQEDKTAIFEEWCSFLNFFDSSIKFELSFVNMATDSTEFEKSIRIPFQKDGFDDVRAEYSQMLRQQLAKGNNGLTKTKFITFGVEGESMAQVKPRLDHIQNDLLNNFHRLGVQAKPLNGAQRLKLMHDMFNMDGASKFHFDWKDLVKSGLSVKDAIAPTAFAFKNSRTFQMGGIFCFFFFKQKTAYEISDQLLKDFLDMDSSQIVTMHIQSVDQNKAIKTVKRTITELVKTTVYDAVVPFLPQAPVWGSLTGVRPAKLARGMIERGMTRGEAAVELREHFHVSPERTALTIRAAATAMEMDKTIGENDISLYVGIPFCPSRCYYCSFVSATTAQSGKLIEPYLDTLCREIEETAALVRAAGKQVQSVYIGGGTPTTLDEHQLARLLSALENHFDFSHLREYTVEAGRPDTITPEKLRVLKSAGVGRVSINPQSMNDAVLAAIGRKHGSADVLRPFDEARQAGFDEINMDLIAGLTGDTAETFAQTVDTLLNLSPENITVHTLAIKRGADLTDKAAAAAQRETVSQMLDGASHALQNAGYGPYYLYRQKFMAGGFENVGWCKPGTECFYNVSMMEELQTILSLGAGGVSKRVVRETGWIERANNPKYPLEYIQAADRLANGKKKLLFPKK